MANGQGFSATVGSGYVLPSTFVSFMTVTADTSDVIAGYAVQQSVVSSFPCGIAQEGTRLVPINENAGQAYAGASAAYSGNSNNDPIKVYALGDICMLSIATTVSPGNLLSPNASGQGILATGTQPYGALAIEGGTSGDLIRVQVVLGVN